jgi:methionyl-tRNA formyltransferase
MNKQAKSSVSSVRIVLFGREGGFTRPVLEQLLAHGLCVAAVVIADTTHDNRDFPVAVNQPRKPGGLAETASKNKVDVLTTQKLDDKSFIDQLTEKRADLFLVACFAQKIPALIWQHMKIPCWNLHPSLLPKYRGPSPLYWQIKNAESETGLTLHEVTGTLDAGDIIARESIPLPENPNKILLDNWVSEHGVKLFNKTLNRYLQGKLDPEPQDDKAAGPSPSPSSPVPAKAGISRRHTGTQ